jgi:putative heme iron utilization protein
VDVDVKRVAATFATNRDHIRAAQEPAMSQPDTSNAGKTVRFLIRAAARAALGTTMPDGRPYVSLVELATDGGGSPLLLLSGLAQHTRNLAVSPAVSLLVDGTAGTLDGPRATLLGTLEANVDEAARERYLARHPQARDYAGFADFRFHRLRVERAHLVAGFGRVEWLDGAEAVLPEAECAALAAAERGIVAHMNEDHADAIGLYATALGGAVPGDWRMTGIDPEGFDLADGARRLRLTFDTFIGSAQQARTALVDLVGRARRASAA